ncbi:hypothetical protein TKK_0003447 [Trichogramma kaykai]
MNKRKKLDLNSYSRASKYRMLQACKDNPTDSESLSESNPESSDSSSCRSIKKAKNPGTRNRSLVQKSTHYDELYDYSMYNSQRSEQNSAYVCKDKESSEGSSDDSSEESLEEPSEESSDDSSDELSDFDEEDVIKKSNAPLYPGAKITIGESLISILKLSVRFTITGVLLAAILELIALHCPEPNFGIPSKNDLTFSWNTDGVPIFKSSKMSIWPFYLMVNELPYKLRIKKENVILAGLWFGVEKPSENLFMESMIEQLNDLYNGINVEILKSNEFVKIRGIILSGTCDLPAKALFMNIKQFNSCHGCPNCKIKTRNLEKTRVYPYVENLDLRTTKETRLFATQAHETNKSVFGLKPVPTSYICEINTSSLITIEIKNILKICNFFKIDNMYYIVEPVNLIENE